MIAPESEILRNVLKKLKPRTAYVSSVQMMQDKDIYSFSENRYIQEDQPAPELKLFFILLLLLKISADEKNYIPRFFIESDSP